MNELLKQVKENKETLKVLREQDDEQSGESYEKRRQVEEKYRKEIRQLEDHKDNEITILDNIRENQKKELKQKEEELYKPLMEVKKIFKVFDIKLKKDKEGLKTPQVYKYDYIKNDKGYIEGDKVRIFYNPVTSIKNNNLIQLYAYITKNRKPLNCFSLIVVGNTYLSGLVEEQYSYWIDAHIDDSNIRKGIKDFKTEEEAKTYLDKNKDKILKDWIQEHNEAEKYYNEKVVLWNDKEWKIAYWEEKKDYYENHYSHGTETEEYKSVCDKLEKLNLEIKK